MLMAPPEKEWSRDEGNTISKYKIQKKKEEENGFESFWPGKGLEMREELKSIYYF